ncbi:DUF6497 family protein [Ketogulonicigenium vulgare]|nr:DUF6497 family protein [Ketogulonicigenium vulgare]
MMRRIALALAIGMASGASAQQVIAPSGVEVQLYDVRFDEDAARFRFVAPVLAGVAEVPDSWTADATWLCTYLALPALSANDVTPAQVVVSVSGAEVPFGEATPDVPQFFEGFAVADGACQWGLF